MTNYVVATESLKVGDETRFYGDPIPEASGWPNVRPWVNGNKIKEVNDGDYKQAIKDYEERVGEKAPVEAEPEVDSGTGEAEAEGGSGDSESVEPEPPSPTVDTDKVLAENIPDVMKKARRMDEQQVIELIDAEQQMDEPRVTLVRKLQGLLPSDSE